MKLLKIAPTILFFSLCAGPIGCRYLGLSSPAIQPVNKSSLVSNSESSPFSLEVLDAINDGTRLTVYARLVPHVAWKRADATVLLYGLDKGRRVSESSHSFATAAKDGEFAPEIPEELSLAIPADGISEYQVELIWDSGRGSNLKSGISSPVLVEDVQVFRKQLPCQSPPCLEKVSVSARLSNPGRKILSKITLGVGFATKDPAEAIDFVGKMPKNEDILSLGSAVLKPGGTRDIRVNIKEPINDPEHKYTVVLRVLSFDEM
ncbi:MAG: hypothetical protein KDD53_00140 [Bdellovibrionales bacterium]|nr:hypothetical protein [Bdellovibrionales bacterium]